MSKVTQIDGLSEIRARTRGRSEILIAFLDGPVATDHPSLSGASLTHSNQLTPDRADPPGAMTAHGTAVVSLVLGQPDSSVEGVAPGCRGLSIPIFGDSRSGTSQLQITRGLEEAVERGAQIINISAGEYSDTGDPHPMLQRAVELCARRNVLIVAAVGNDGCDCLHVPASVESTLAVGATDADGRPADFSNWGEAYLANGIVAPGHEIECADAGGGVTIQSGTSIATPVVTGVAALLLSHQVDRGQEPDPALVGRILRETVEPCSLGSTAACRPYLVGSLNITGALKKMGEIVETTVNGTTEGGVDASCECEEAVPARADLSESDPQGAEVGPSAVEPSNAGQLVYAMGNLGYDFGTEARRDSFKQLMAVVDVDGTQVPANPYDARQMVDHLAARPSEGKAVIWTLSLELTPIYALRPVGPFAHEVYTAFQELLAGEVAAQGTDAYVDRVSVPGWMTGQSVRLFSGQTVPVIEMDNTRGLYGWHIHKLLDHAIQRVKAHYGGSGKVDEGEIRAILEGFLSRVYYDLHNLGLTSRDRALNFAATNAFQAVDVFARAVGEGMSLDGMDVQPSAFCRKDSDCWDVKLKFFDPENTRRARRVFRFTIDVSDTVPVTVGEVRSWATSV